jgi:ketosteroid isomerase-like protein
MSPIADRPTPVEDELAVVAVAVRYTWALDQHDFDALDEVFLPEATAVLGGPPELVGRDAIKQRIHDALHRLDDSQHLVGNHQVVVDGDTATHRCYLHAQHVRRDADGGPHYVVAGRYEDRLVRTPGGWRIAHRDLVVMWTEGNVAVIRPT